MWYKALINRYGESDGNFRERGRASSIWWKDIPQLDNGDSEPNNGWFRTRVKKEVGDGKDTSFWSDWWREIKQ